MFVVKKKNVKMSFLICNCRIGYQIPMFAGFCIMFLSTLSEYIQFLVLFLTSISHLSVFMGGEEAIYLCNA